MTARLVRDPAPFRRRPRAPQPTVTTRPHSSHVLGGPAQFDLVLDSGPDTPVQVVELTRDMAAIIRTQLDTKLQGAQHE